MEETDKKEIVLTNHIMGSKPIKDRFYQIPERAMLYAFSVLSAPALRLFLILAGQKNGFKSDRELYQDRAHLTDIQYPMAENELINKEFLYKDIEGNYTVMCPPIAYLMEFDGNKRIIINF